MSEKSHFLSPSMSPSSSPRGATHHRLTAFTIFRISSRLAHAQSTRLSTTWRQRSFSSSVPGTFVINLGKFGGFYIIRVPPIVQKILSILLRKWKTLVFVALFGTLAAFGLFGAMSTEWREMTYYRVDPYPIVPGTLKTGHGSSSPFHPPSSRPITPPKFGACLGPREFLFQEHRPSSTTRRHAPHPARWQLRGRRHGLRQMHDLPLQVPDVLG